VSEDTADVSLPYRGPEEFRFVDHVIFTQREQEIWEILQLITLYRGVVIYGQSGNGKSSLVNAGLIPELIRQGYTVDRVRVQFAPAGEYLVERVSMREEGTAPFLESGLIENISQKSSTALTAKEFDAALQRSLGQKRFFLVFDQFEEIVTRFEESYGEERLAARARILGQLEQVLHSDSLPVKLLFVFREDYLAPVRSLLARCPEVFRQYYWLRAPTTEKTAAIIEGPLRFVRFQGKFGGGLTQELAAQLNSRARNGAINLTDLQIACLELWKAEKPDQLLERRKVDGLIQDYLARALDPLKKSGLHEPAIALLGTMVTPQGTRNVISEYDAVARVAPAFRVSETMLRQALNELTKTRLVRKSVEGEGTYYEITSEFLSAWINDNRARQEVKIQREKAERELRGRSRVAFVFLALGAVLLFFMGLYLYTWTSARANARRQQQLLQSAQAQITLLSQQKGEADRALRALSSRTSAQQKGRGVVFGSDTLETAIGVVFLLLLLGLICSAVNELIALAFNSRARTLERGLNKLLTNHALMEELYHHPLIKALTQDGTRPTYIPSHTFAMALLDIVAPARLSRVQVSDEEVLQALGAQVFTLPHSDLRRSLLLLVSQSRRLSELYRNVETWFDNVMDAVAGAFKRRTQIQLLTLAFCLAVAVNVDTLAVITSLSSGNATRALVAAAAQDYEKGLGTDTVAPGSPRVTLAELEQRSQIPITWSGSTAETSLPSGFRNWLKRILGWCITAFGVAVCAAFWFDFLNRFMVVRSTIKPYQIPYGATTD
jgi:hypothetical protein